MRTRTRATSTRPSKTSPPRPSAPRPRHQPSRATAGRTPAAQQYPPPPSKIARRQGAAGSRAAVGRARAAHVGRRRVAPPRYNWRPHTAPRSFRVVPGARAARRFGAAGRPGYGARADSRHAHGRPEDEAAARRRSGPAVCMRIWSLKSAHAQRPPPGRLRTRAGCRDCRWSTCTPQRWHGVPLASAARFLGCPGYIQRGVWQAGPIFQEVYRRRSLQDRGGSGSGCRHIRAIGSSTCYSSWFKLMDAR